MSFHTITAPPVRAKSNAKLANSFHVLNAAFRQAVEGITITDQIAQVMDALNSDAFKAAFSFEPIYGQRAIIAHEALARPRGNGLDYPIQSLVQKIYALGLARELDVLTVANALKQTRKLPVSINVSVESALNEEFWDDVMLRVAKFEPRHIIFEILEHDVQLGADTLALAAVKGAGYRIALDDFGYGGEHERRLAVFGDLADFIKFDGSFLQNLYTYDPYSLKALISRLKAGYPDAKLIAEHVKHFDQARILFDLGFYAVQGRSLNPEDYWPVK